MENFEFEKLVPFNIKENIKYESNKIVIIYLLREPPGNIAAISVDYGKVYKADASPYITFIKILDGKAELVVENISTYMKSDDCMIIPSYVPFTLEANQRFKMMSIVLKSDNDDPEP
ncbi:hypothetical protein M0G43_08425 [Subsaxibacter sp. CAU 1640]|uniref:hypothetical protein n=1 Tax=Subsaxibacter sp. CAU 1640 TaxID=2933271 RepID=UPI0020045601|nr:hypothetical protein [Subsaxibacter sp. CAU 1640]MCK7590595.1 hypothetical protein [Subsaxibacter sp. CAU 1640]